MLFLHDADKTQRRTNPVIPVSVSVRVMKETLRTFYCGFDALHPVRRLAQAVVHVPESHISVHSENCLSVDVYWVDIIAGGAL